jgi:hypothetical protein
MESEASSFCEHQLSIFKLSESPFFLIMLLSIEDIEVWYVGTGRLTFIFVSHRGVHIYIYIYMYIYMYLRPSVSISFCYSSPYAYWCVLRQGIFGIQSITTPPGVACDRSFGSSARRNLGEPGRPRRSGRSMDPWWEVSINSNKTMVYGRYIYT